MITADRKPFEEIIASVKNYDKIMVLGCETCVAVCQAGGEKEAEILASELRLAFGNEGKEVEVNDEHVIRQCDDEFMADPAFLEKVKAADVVLSIACGVGVQFTAEKYPNMPVYPGVNTCFMGATEERGLWTERCQGCGSCILARTGGICPVSRCAKRLFNGPCGGSTAGRCEIATDVPCAWQLIIDRLKALGRLDDYEDISPIKDWSTDRAGGPRKVVREDVQL